MIDASNRKVKGGKNFYADLQAKRKQTKQKKMGDKAEQQESKKLSMDFDQS